MERAGASSKQVGSQCPSDLDLKFAFKPGFDSRFTFGTMLSCSSFLAIVVGAAALLGPPALLSAGDVGAAPLLGGGAAPPLGGPPAPAAVGGGGKVECEGYWPPPSVCLKLGTEAVSAGVSGAEGCPQLKMRKDWEGKAEFLEKLQLIEKGAKDLEGLGMVPAGCSSDEALSTVRLLRYRGLSWSRVEEGTVVGSAEFEDSRGRQVACWPDGFSEHYVREHDVVPSDRFLQYVRGFDADGFVRAVRKLTTCVETQAERGG